MQLEKLWELLKKDSALTIFILSSIGTALTMLIKGLEIIYKYARYIKLNIPLYYLESTVSINLILSIVVITVTIILSIFMLIAYMSYYDKLKAYWVFDASFHTQPRPKIKQTLKKLMSIIFLIVILFIINIPCVLLSGYEVVRDKKLSVFLGLAIMWAEYEIARTVKKIMEPSKEREWKFEPYNSKDKMKILKEKEKRELNAKYLRYKPILSFSSLINLSITLLLISVTVWGTYYVGEASVTDAKIPCYITVMNDQEYIILDKTSTIYILAPIIKESNQKNESINIDVSKQYITDTNEIEAYQIRKFDKIILNKR